MPYPNTTASVIVISQTSGSAIGGQYPFIERQISGSNLFLVTDANGFLTGSTSIPGGSFTSLTVTGALTASIISASTALTSAAATFAGPVTMSSVLSASGGITASNIQDTGTLNVLGTTTLSTTNITGLLSASGNITASNIYDAGTLVVVGNSVLTSLTASNISASTITGVNTISGANLIVSANSLTSSTLYVTSNAVVNNLTASSISASAGISASNIYDAGTLTVVGNTTVTNITASGGILFTGAPSIVTGANLVVSASSINAASSIIDGGSLTVLGNTTLGDQITDITAITGSLNQSGSFNTQGSITASGTISSSNISASNVFITNNLIYKESMATGSLNADVYLSASAVTQSNIVLAVDASVATGSAYALVLNATSSKDGVAYALSASAGIIVGTTFSGSTFSGTAFSGSLTGQNVTVLGTSTFNGLLSASGGITTSNISASSVNVGQSLGVGSSVTIGQNLTVSGTSTFNNTVSVNGTLSSSVLTSSTILATTIFSPTISASVISASAITASLSGSIISSNATIAGGTINNTSIGATIPSTGNFTNLTASNISASGTISGSNGWFSQLTAVGLTASISGSITNASSASIATNNSTATVQYITFVDGTGAKPLYVDQDSLTWQPSTNTLSSSGGISASAFNASGNIAVNGGSITTTAATFNLASTATALNIGGANTTASHVGILDSSNTTAATISRAGAIVTDGGVYIGKNLVVSGSTTLYGDVTMIGTGSIVNISSSTVIIGDNRIALNAWSVGGPQRYGGIDVFDSGSSAAVTSSLLWDSLNNYWLLQSNNSGSPITASSALILQGPTSSFGSEYLLTVNNFLKVQTTTGNMITSSLSEVGNTLQYNGTISASVISGSRVYGLTGSFNNLNVFTGSSPGVGGVPSAPTDGGLPGQIEVDNNFIYVYTNNIWKRVPVSVWSA